MTAHAMRAGWRLTRDRSTTRPVFTLEQRDTAVRVQLEAVRAVRLSQLTEWMESVHVL